MILGAVLALMCGLINSVAAALEKREGQRVDGGLRGLRLLGALCRRWRWTAGMALGGLAWVAETASLVLAPIAVVATARSAGRALLVPVGSHWLKEHFSVSEAVGVAVAVLGGALVATGTLAGRTSVTRSPLPDVELLGVGAITAVIAWAASRLHTGIGSGAAVGLLFAATGVYTKAIGDRLSMGWSSGLEAVLGGPALWIMLLFSVWSQSILQTAFRGSTAASLSATSSVVSSIGLVVAGYCLYQEPFPLGWREATLLSGLMASVVGIGLLAVGSRLPDSDSVL